MGEAHRTSEARMRAASEALVRSLDDHIDGLGRVEAITALGTALGVYAMAWGGEAEVVGGVAKVARTLVEGQRAKAAADVPRPGDLVVVDEAWGAYKTGKRR